MSRKKRPYRLRSVKSVRIEKVLETRPDDATMLWAGIDISKSWFDVVLRWRGSEFELRPIRCKGSDGLRCFVALMKELSAEAMVLVALEPSGTYGDPLRHQLALAGIRVFAVRPKASHDYAEIHDGVPSSHDGKSAAVVAELAITGKCKPWDYETPQEDDKKEALAELVHEADRARRDSQTWTNGIEALLARYWPEAHEQFDVTSVTFVRILEKWGGPSGFAAAGVRGIAQACKWGGPFLDRAKVVALSECAGATVGVPETAVSRRRMKNDARRSLAAQRQCEALRKRMEKLGASVPQVQQQKQAVGLAASCALHTSLGDPSDYGSAAAYEKAAGLNLKERSSGRWKGHLRITKRGPSCVRRLLYFAALRTCQMEEVKPWYDAYVARHNGQKGKAIVAIMRRLVRAAYHVAVTGKPFDAAKLFAGTYAAALAAAK